MDSIPAVKQCVDTEDRNFGAVAVKAEGETRWGVMHPTRGGRWAYDPEVDGWTPLSG